jgi:hypothetical protein
MVGVAFWTGERLILLELEAQSLKGIFIGIPSLVHSDDCIHCDLLRVQREWVDAAAPHSINAVVVKELCATCVAADDPCAIMPLVENRAFVLSSKWHLHRLAYGPILKGFFSTGSSCQRAKWSPWSSSTGLLGTISTGSCHEPVLKVSRLPRGRCQKFSTGSWHEPVLKATLLHRFRTRTDARDPAYKYSRPPAFSSVFFLWKV